jgi:hypothetical protein
VGGLLVCDMMGWCRDYVGGRRDTRCSFVVEMFEGNGRGICTYYLGFVPSVFVIRKDVCIFPSHLHFSLSSSFIQFTGFKHQVEFTNRQYIICGGIPGKHCFHALASLRTTTKRMLEPKHNKYFRKFREDFEALELFIL